MGVVRTTFLIDREGRIQKVMPKVKPDTNAAEVLACLRGEWHHSSVFMDGVYFGIRNRLVDGGIEMERLPLPDALLERVREAVEGLQAIR